MKSIWIFIGVMTLVLIGCKSSKKSNMLEDEVFVKDVKTIKDNYDQMFLSGYKKKNDGGEGHLKLVNKGSHIVDNGLFFYSTKKGKIWQRIVGDTMTTLHYGIENSAKKDVTVRIQAMIEAAYRNSKSVIKFSEGNYLIGTLDFHPGVEFLGTKDTWLLKTPKSGKFDRMFRSKGNQYSSTKNSKVLKFTDLNIDGQMDKQGKHDEYELEHQQMIFLAAKQKSKGRLQVEIDNCYFKNGVSDAIHIYHNVDAKITNCIAENVFRGGVVVGGGSSSVEVKNFKAFGDIHVTGIDIEVDGRGYDGNYEVDVTMEDIFLAGDCDIAVKEGSFYGKNIICSGPPFYLASRHGKIFIEDSKFYSSSKKKGRILIPKDMHFKNCQFTYLDDGDTNNFLTEIFWSVKDHIGKNQKLHFEGCTFSIENHSGKKVTALKSLVDKDYRGNEFVVSNSKIDKEFAVGIHLTRGGVLNFMNSENYAELPFRFNSVNKKNVYDFNYKVKIDKLKTSSDKQTIIEMKKDSRNTVEILDTSVPMSAIKSTNNKKPSKAKRINN